MPNVSTLAYGVWIATVVAYAVLVGIMLYRRALCRWPWVFGFAGISSLIAAALLLVYHLRCAPEVVHHPPTRENFFWSAIYFWSYWGERFALGACHFGIIWNVASTLLPSSRHWRRPLIYAMLGLTVLALAISAAVTLATPRPLYVDVMRLANSLDRWLSLASCILFVIIAFSLDGIGIRWRRETLFVGMGLALQGVLFTAFAWYVGARSLTPKEMATPSLIRDLIELASVALWTAAFVPSPKLDSYAAISADRLQSTIESLKHVVAGV